jgi:hypothetical protein
VYCFLFQINSYIKYFVLKGQSAAGCLPTMFGTFVEVTFSKDFGDFDKISHIVGTLVQSRKWRS